MNSAAQAPLNARLHQFTASAIADIFVTASRLKAQGVDVIDLSVGEPDFDTPAHIKAAGIAAIEGNHTKYTSSDGTDALKAAVARKFKRDNGVDYGVDEITIDSGVKPLLYHLLNTLLDQGNEVIVPTPCWASYPGMVKLAGGEPVLVHSTAEQSFKLQADALEAAITDKTRVLMLNSPSNPTGAAYSFDEMRSLTEVLLRHPHVWLISDEIYEHIVFDGFKNANPVAVEPRLRERCVIVNGVSKAYSMTGWRIGYAAAPQRVTTQLLKVLSQAVGSPCSISQAAAVAALDGPQNVLRSCAEQYQQRRDYVLARFAQMSGVDCAVPEGAFYLYPCVAGLIGKRCPDGSLIESSADFARYVLTQANVAIVPGSAFSCDPFFRLSYATSMENLRRACDRLAGAVSALN